MISKICIIYSKRGETNTDKIIFAIFISLIIFGFMDDLIGQKIENFRFLSILGRGGMGIVYLAMDEKLQRQVAIKVLNSSNISNKAHIIERFRIEAQNHAQLVHNNIVTVYGFIEFNNQFAIIMEYVEGESLDKVIEKNKRIHISDVVYIVNQLLDGIDYAHKKGYIHRDIKPSNIIVNTEGIVKLMDFGISKSLVEEFPKTKTGARVGTIYYMSPEQIKGSTLTPQSDLYSIGCSVYEMITGLPPFFSQNEFDVLDGHLHKEFKPINDFAPKLNSELNNILQNLLKKVPVERYKTAYEVSKDLIPLTHFIEQSESDYFVIQKKQKLLSKRKSVAGFSMLILTFLALLVFVFFQVKDFMKYKGYTVFEDGGVPNTSKVDSNFSISITSVLDLSSKLSINAGIFNKNGLCIIVGDSGIIYQYNIERNIISKVATESSQDILNIFNLSDEDIIAIGENSILLRGNLNQYLEPTKISKNAKSLFGIDFLDENIGIIVGTEGVIFRTTDGGKTWKTSNSNTKENLFDIKFVDSNKLFSVGMNGTLLSSSDQGISWENINTGTDKYLKSISFIDSEKGIIVGGSGTVLKTDDGGINWEIIQTVTANALNKIRYIDNDLILAAGNLGTIIISEDSGFSWKMIESKYFNNWNDILISQMNEKKIFLIGSNGTFVQIIRGEN